MNGLPTANLLRAAPFRGQFFICLVLGYYSHNDKWSKHISITNNIFETKLKYISIFLCNLGQNFCRRNTLPTNITISDHDYIPSVLFQFFTYSNHIFCHILEVGIYNGCTFCINFSDFFHNRDNCF